MGGVCGTPDIRITVGDLCAPEGLCTWAIAPVVFELRRLPAS